MASIEPLNDLVAEIETDWYDTQPAIGDTRACPDCRRPQHYTGTEHGWAHDALIATWECNDPHKTNGASTSSILCSCGASGFHNCIRTERNHRS